MTRFPPTASTRRTGADRRHEAARALRTSSARVNTSRLLPAFLLLAGCTQVQATQGRLAAAHQRTEAGHAAAAAQEGTTRYADGCPRTEDRAPLGPADTTWHEVQAGTKAAPAGERPVAKLPWDAEIASGRVDVQFAVDQAGCVDMRTVTVLESNNRDATEAVRRVLPLYRYSPAVRNGAPVRQWVTERIRVGR